MELMVAVDENWAIGYKNHLLAHISTDLKRFKAMTMGRSILLGRKTLQTFPGGKPLLGRKNWILSANPACRPEGGVVLRSFEEAIERCPKDIFVIGGAQIYRTFLPWCETAYVTKIHGKFPADAWFPNLDRLPEWEITQEEAPLVEGDVSFHFVTYKRRG